MCCPLPLSTALGCLLDGVPCPAMHFPMDIRMETERLRLVRLQSPFPRMLCSFRGAEAGLEVKLTLRKGGPEREQLPWPSGA